MRWSEINHKAYHITIQHGFVYVWRTVEKFFWIRLWDTPVQLVPL